MFKRLLKDFKEDWFSFVFISLGILAIAVFGYFGGKGYSNDAIVFAGEDTVRYWALLLCILWGDIFFYLKIDSYRKDKEELERAINEISKKQEIDVENLQKYSITTRNIILKHILEE